MVTFTLSMNVMNQRLYPRGLAAMQPGRVNSLQAACWMTSENWLAEDEQSVVTLGTPHQLCPAAAVRMRSHPDAISAFASASGFPHSTVMMVARSSLAARMPSYHLTHRRANNMQ
jgi:hypothetical protein